MKTLNLKKRSLIIIFVLVSCGSDDSLGTTYIPSYDAQWPDKGDSEHFIDLRNDNPNSESGTLKGTELHFSDSSKDNIPLTGTFKGLNIEFTIKRSANNPLTPDVKYTGTMVPVSETNHNIVTINLKSSEGTLVLGN